MVQETLLNDRYRLISQQGAGGMAVIYKAQDVALGRIVAVKILRPSLTKDEAFLRRFRQEARSVANLAHPNVVTVHDFGQDGDTYYMVMEFVEGQNLKRLVRAEAPFTIERALDLTIQICAGVGYAHRAGLVHADVKPQNVLVTEEGIVKVTDFGIARALAANMPSSLSVVWGSPHYFAPEQAQGHPPSPAADVYAIGVVLFEMLAGQLPYSGKDHQALAMAHIQEEVPFVSDVNPKVPRQLGRIVRKVMAKEPSARYRTADQLKRILSAYRQQGYETTDKGAAQQAAALQPQPQPPPEQPAPPPPTVPAQPALPPYQQAPQATKRAQLKPSSPPEWQRHAPPQPPQSQPAAPPAYKRRPPAHPSPKPADFESYHPLAQPKATPGRASRRIDWIGIILGVLALISVLGLIPLWLRVYHLWVVIGGG